MSRSFRFASIAAFGVLAICSAACSSAPSEDEEPSRDEGALTSNGKYLCKLRFGATGHDWVGEDDDLEAAKEKAVDDCRHGPSAWIAPVECLRNKQTAAMSCQAPRAASWTCKLRFGATDRDWVGQDVDMAAAKEKAVDDCRHGEHAWIAPVECLRNRDTSAMTCLPTREGASASNEPSRPNGTAGRTLRQEGSDPNYFVCSDGWHYSVYDELHNGEWLINEEQPGGEVITPRYCNGAEAGVGSGSPCASREAAIATAQKLCATH